MPRANIHSDDLGPVEQRKPVPPNATEAESEVILVDGTGGGDYADELLFMDEAVTIRLEPSSDKNAPTAFPVWVNGKMAEVFSNGRWYEIGYLPVGRELTVKRKVLEVIARAKVDNVQTRVVHRDGENPNNLVDRQTTAMQSFTVIEDKNPRGHPWLTEMRRRNL